MQTHNLLESNTESKDYLCDNEIHIEANPDSWQSGFIWSVSLGDIELYSGMEYSNRSAEMAANQYLKSLNVPK